MTGTHGIDVRLFHQADILQHAFFRHHLTRLRIHFMTVHTTQTSRNTIDQQLSVTNFQLSETHFCCYLLNGLIKRILQQKLEGIKIRGFSRPFLGVFDSSLQPTPFGIAALGSAVVEKSTFGIEIQQRLSPNPPYEGGSYYFLIVGGIEGSSYVVTFASLAFTDGEFGMNDELGILIILVKNSTHAEIADTDLIGGIKINAPMNASQTPLVLIFEIRAVGIFQDFEDNTVNPLQTSLRGGF